MKIERILIPTDLSEQSRIALQSVNQFVEKFGSTVDLIHIVPFSQYLGESFSKLGMPFDMETDIYPKIIKSKKEELQKFLDDHIENEEKRGEVIVKVDRKPSVAIVEQSKKKNYGLIMMSSKGYHESDLFHGSITDKVIRRSQVPVLTLGERMVGTKVNTILVPCDFSNRSLSALPIAYELAKSFGAELHLLHIIELYAADLHGTEYNTAGIDNVAVYKDLRKKIQEYLKTEHKGKYHFNGTEEDFLDEMVEQSGSVDTHVPVRSIVTKAVSAHREILDHANANADLLVMTTHGRSGLSRVLLGSTAEQVVQEVEIPQLTLKPVLND